MHTDKNGDPIYEGVQVKFGDIVGEVRFPARNFVNIHIIGKNGTRTSAREDYVERVWGDPETALATFWGRNLCLSDMDADSERRLGEIARAELLTILRMLDGYHVPLGYMEAMANVSHKVMENNFTLTSMHAHPLWEAFMKYRQTAREAL